MSLTLRCLERGRTRPKTSPGLFRSGRIDTSLVRVVGRPAAPGSERTASTRRVGARGEAESGRGTSNTSVHWSSGYEKERVEDGSVGSREVD